MISGAFLVAGLWMREAAKQARHDCPVVQLTESLSRFALTKPSSPSIATGSDVSTGCDSRSPQPAAGRRQPLADVWGGAAMELRCCCNKRSTDQCAAATSEANYVLQQCTGLEGPASSAALVMPLGARVLPCSLQHLAADSPNNTPVRNGCCQPPSAGPSPPGGRVSAPLAPCTTVGSCRRLWDRRSAATGRPAADC